MNPTAGYWFTSSLFDVDPREDQETNPRLYGRQPAEWLRAQLLALGYLVEEVFGEDWGWCVMCQREPYSLWVGCVNLRDYKYAKEGDPPPAKNKLLWNAVPMAEIPFFRYLFRRKPSTSEGLAKLDSQLRSILEAEPNIQLSDESVAKNWFHDSKSTDVPAHDAYERADGSNSAGLSLGARIVLTLFATLFGVMMIAMASPESGSKAAFF